MTLNVALIGLDGHQGIILDAIPEMDGVRLVGVAADPSQLESLRSHSAVGTATHFYTDYRKLLDTESLHIVALCNVNGERAAVLRDCLRTGAHILAEKPLVTELRDLEEIRRLVVESGVRLSMLLTMRFEPAYQLAQDVVESGAIGEPILLTSQKSYRLGERPEWMKRRRSFGGTIPFIGIHVIDLMRWISGKEFVEAAAYHSNAGHPEVGEMEDNATVLLRMENGGSASARLDYCRPAAAPTHGDDRLRVAGSKGVLEVTECGQRVTLVTDVDPPGELPVPPPQSFFEDFVAAVRGEREHRISQADVFRTTEICLKVRDAADQGKNVRL